MKMRNIILPASFVMLAFAAAMASAGSLGGQLADPPVTRPAPQFSWTGPYAGISAGVTRSKHRRDITEKRQETRPYTKADAYEDARENGFQLLSPTGDQEHRAHCQAFGYAPIGYLNCGVFDPSSYLFGESDPEVYPVSPERLEEYRREEVPGVDPVVVDEWEEVVGTETYRRSHATWGLFTGYRHQFQGGAVLGGELAYNKAGSLDSFEAKTQVGYALGRLLPYAAAGIDLTDSQAVYGVGLDYALTNRWLAGAEYTHMDKTKADRINLKLGLRF